VFGEIEAITVESTYTVILFKNMLSHAVKTTLVTPFPTHSVAGGRGGKVIFIPGGVIYCEVS